MTASQRIMIALVMVLLASCPVAFSLPEAGGAPPLPPPFEAFATVIASTRNATLLEVMLQPNDLDRLPAPDAITLGLVAIAPTGGFDVAVRQIEGAPVSAPEASCAIPAASLPPGVVRLGMPAIWRDVRVVEVLVAPCWENADGHFLARRLVVEIWRSSESGINEKTRPVTGVSPVWERLYRRHILNYDSLNLPRMTRGTGTRYMVVSRTLFDAQTPQFVEWKSRQGYGVELVTLEALGYSDPSTNAAMDATKNYILNAYNTWPDGLDFVLLVGDMYSSALSGSIWTKSFYNYFYSQGNRPHDQWYGLLEGSDVFADVMVGRFPDSNATRMNYLIGKSVSYEKTPYINGTWQKNALMTLKATHYNPDVNNHIIAAKNFVSDILSAWGMNSIERFQSQASSSQILPVINQGVTFYNYRGDYCSSTDWNGTFSDGDVAYVNNTNRPGVWSVLSCSSACFDYSYSSTAELLLRRDYTDPGTLRGAVAFIGSQAYTSYLFNDPLDQGIYLAWTDSGATMVGQSLLSGKLYAWSNATGLSAGERNCGMYEYTTLGDPSLQVNTDVPDASTVVASHSQVPVGQTTNVTLIVTATGRGPVNEALVCLRKATDVYTWGYTNAAGQVTLGVTPASAGSIDLTATAYNVQPYLGTIAATVTANPQRPENVTANPSGTNLVLTWSPVTHDVTGASISIDHYDVYRHTVAHFLVGGLTPIASPTGTTFTDVGILGDAGLNHFYRIVAVATTGLKSAPSLPVGEFEIATSQ